MKYISFWLMSNNSVFIKYFASTYLLFMLKRDFKSSFYSALRFTLKVKQLSLISISLKSDSSVMG